MYAQPAHSTLCEIESDAQPARKLADDIVRAGFGRTGRYVLVCGTYDSDRAPLCLCCADATPVLSQAHTSARPLGIHGMDLLRVLLPWRQLLPLPIGESTVYTVYGRHSVARS
jgi:hypothetical protein